MKKIKDTRRSAFEQKMISELAPPRILATRLLKKIIATASCFTPREVRVPRGMNMANAFPKNKRKDIEGEIIQAESYLLSVALTANEYSRHKSMFEHEQVPGGSEHFHQTWRNLLGNQTVAAMGGMIHSWKRWKEHVRETPSQWTGRSEKTAIFNATAGALARYAGVTNTGGVIAARGAVAALW